jgi:DMSO/TMAO reductase YedYZ heme-binding membrane subunit
MSEVASGFPEAEIVVRPTIVGVIASIISFGLAAGSTVLLVNEWDTFTRLGQLFFTCAALIFVIVPVDHLQRVYVIRRRRIAIRLLFIWRVIDVTSIVQCDMDSLGRIVLSSNNKTILRIPWGYQSRGSTLLPRLQVLFSSPIDALR